LPGEQPLARSDRHLLTGSSLIPSAVQPGFGDNERPHRPTPPASQTGTREQKRSWQRRPAAPARPVR